MKLLEIVEIKVRKLIYEMPNLSKQKTKN